MRSYNSDLCRICMNNNTNLKDIFSSTSILTISTAIMECAPVSISETDTLPHQICPCCLCKLEIAYNFRILCIQTDQTLRNNVVCTIVKEEQDENLTITPITETETLLDDFEIKIEKDENSYAESLSDNGRISDNDQEDITDLKELNVERLSKQQPETNSKHDQSVAIKNVLRQKNDKYFQCEQCPKIYKFIKGFRKHLTLHNCDNQNDITAQKKQNVKKRAPKSEKKRKEDGYFHCEQCSKKYKDWRAFTIHLTAHTNFRYKCDKCGKKYWHRYYFKEHMKIVHATESKYSCEFCGKTFRGLRVLQGHHRVHSELRTFKCHVCAKDFKMKNILLNHLLIHKGERPFVCGQCGSNFKRKDHLTVHEQLHTGKRFKCICCGHAFQTKQSMNSHLLKCAPQLS